MFDKRIPIIFKLSGFTHNAVKITSELWWGTILSMHIRFNKLFLRFSYVCMNVHQNYLNQNNVSVESFFYCDTLTIDTVHDFLIKLGIKPRLHILKIGIFSLNHVIVRPTKIMNNLLKVWKILRHQKSTKSFWIFFSVKNIWLGDQLL